MSESQFFIEERFNIAAFAAQLQSSAQAANSENTRLMGLTNDNTTVNLNVNDYRAMINDVAVIAPGSIVDEEGRLVSDTSEFTIPGSLSVGVDTSTNAGVIQNYIWNEPAEGKTALLRLVTNKELSRSPAQVLMSNTSGTSVYLKFRNHGGDVDRSSCLICDSGDGNPTNYHNEVVVQVDCGPIEATSRYVRFTVIQMSGPGDLTALPGGTCLSDYLYWETGIDPPRWLAGSNTSQSFLIGQETTVHIGCGAGGLSTTTEDDEGGERQNAYAVALGNKSGRSSQGTGAVSIGANSGQTTQGNYSVAVGYNAGLELQGARSISIGYNAGISGQGIECIAIGSRSGVQNTTETNATAPVANASSQLTQQNSSIILNATGVGLNTDGGTAAGRPMENIEGVGIDSAAFYVKPIRRQLDNASVEPSAAYGNSLFYNPTTGEIVYNTHFTPGLPQGDCWGEYLFWNQNTSDWKVAGGAGANTGSECGRFSVIVGCEAGHYGYTGQWDDGKPTGAVSIGHYAGHRISVSGEREYAVAVGWSSGAFNQGAKSLSVGNYAGEISQGSSSVALGDEAGKVNQGQVSVAIGVYAGTSSQGASSVAIGASSGLSGQGTSSVAVGAGAGQNVQGEYSVAVGFSSGENGQGNSAVAVGTSAGRISQGNDSVAIGNNAGTSNQGAKSLSVGNYAGEISQGSSSVALGDEAGKVNQGQVSVAIGVYAGTSSQGASSVAIGASSGLSGQGISSVAVGAGAGQNVQGGYSVAIGFSSGENGQGNYAVAVGTLAGRTSQGLQSVAIGNEAGSNNQGITAVAIGNNAGTSTQGNDSVAIGAYAGNVGQSNAAVAIGHDSGRTSQGLQSVAIGNEAGSNNQGITAVAIGATAGYTNQGQYSVAIGREAGRSGQSQASIAIGSWAGWSSQGYESVAVGVGSGRFGQGAEAVAIGSYAGETLQGKGSIAIGDRTGIEDQGDFAVAIGREAGFTSQGVNAIAIGASSAITGQGVNAIAIGTLSGVQNTTVTNATAPVANASSQLTQQNSSIILNATGLGLNTDGGTAAGRPMEDITGVGISSAAFYVKPIRHQLNDASISPGGGYENNLFYNPVTGEIVYARSSVPGLVDGTCWGDYLYWNPATPGWVVGSTQIHLGCNAGASSQGVNAVALGNEAGRSGQGQSSVAIGVNAGTSSQGSSSVALGEEAGKVNQGQVSVAIGVYAGTSSQGASSVAIGASSGLSGQGTSSVAVGAGAGQNVQGGYSVAIGFSSGENGQGNYAVAIGPFSGFSGQGTNGVAIGNRAGASSQGTEAVAIGATAGYTNQAKYSVAIGREAGRSGQSQASIAIGAWSGWSSQGYESVAVGVGSGRFGQGDEAVAIGSYAGETLQGKGSIAIGDRTGILNQGEFAVAIGREAGFTSQGQYSVAIGASSAITGQGVNAIAIGTLSGVQNTTVTNATAPVANASSQLNQQNSSIILNATGVGLNTDGGTAVGRPMEVLQGGGTSSAAFYVKPIRHQLNDASISPGGGYENNLFYNPDTGEIVYARSSVPGLVDGTCWGDYLYWNPATPGWDVGSTQIHLGCNAGASSQGVNAVAIGNEAGHTNQGIQSVSIGLRSGFTGQGSNGVALGTDAGKVNQGQVSVAIGVYAGTSSQGASSVAIGASSGLSGQGTNSVAVGAGAGEIVQGDYCVAIGALAGRTTQGNDAVAIGREAGRSGQQSQSVAIGSYAGQSSQGLYSVAIGPSSGIQGQGNNAVAVGKLAGRISQGDDAVAIGRQTGESTQGSDAVAIGSSAGNLNQGSNSVAIGNSAGRTSQGQYSVAIGASSAITGQGVNAIAIGASSAITGQGVNAIAIGASSAITGQGVNAIAIGKLSGVQNTAATNATAPAANAQSQLTQENSSIILNATGIGLNTDGGTTGGRPMEVLPAGGTSSAAFYVKPIRHQLNVPSISPGGGYEYNLFYNPVTGEIVYSSVDPADIPTGTCWGDYLFWNTTSDTPEWQKGSAQIHLGCNAGASSQGTEAVALGNSAGASSQGTEAVAIGTYAGRTNQGDYAVAIGPFSGFSGQGTNGVAIGNRAGASSQGTEAVAIGATAGYTNQGNYSVAIGREAGRSGQSQASVAIGPWAGWSSQGYESVAVGVGSGKLGQGAEAVAIGSYAGETLQGKGSIAIGDRTGIEDQGDFAVAIGREAGFTSQGVNAIAIGASSAITGQGVNAIAIGTLSGVQNTTVTNATAPVANASSQLTQQNSSIILNATGVGLNTDGGTAVGRPMEVLQGVGTSSAAFYVKPIRHQLDNASVEPSAAYGNSLFYNPTTGEIVYNTHFTPGLPQGDCWGEYIFWNEDTSDWRVAGGAGANTGGVCGRFSVLLGCEAGHYGYTGQWNSGKPTGAVSIGHYAGHRISVSGEREYAVAVGWSSGAFNQGAKSLSVGNYAGEISQGSSSVALGDEAGRTNQGANSVAIGGSSAITGQGDYTVAIGNQAGQTNQGDYAVAIGASSAITGQGVNAIAIGRLSGVQNTGSTNAFAAVANASSQLTQQNSSIILNATGLGLNTDGGTAAGRPMELFKTQTLNLNTTPPTTYSFNSGTLVIEYSSETGNPIANGSRGVVQYDIENSVTIPVIMSNNTNNGFSNQNWIKVGDQIPVQFAQVTNVVEVRESAGFYVKPMRQQRSATAVKGTGAYGNSLFYNEVTGEIVYSETVTPGLPQGECYSDYLFWDPLSGTEGDWSVGSKNIHLGCSAGQVDQVADRGVVAIGWFAGYRSQQAEAIAIGHQAGYTFQGETAVAIGASAGYTNQGAGSIAVGDKAGSNNQGSTAVAIGATAGYTNQGDYAVAIGREAGRAGQSQASVAIGSWAGWSSQGYESVAVGVGSGRFGQGDEAVAIGSYAGETLQGKGSIAIGDRTGIEDQGDFAVAIGREAGFTSQGVNAIAIGASSAITGQGVNAIAIGTLSGVQNTTVTNATAPVANASSQLTQQNSSIILNATGLGLNTDGGTAVGRPMEDITGVGISSAAFYVKPIRHQLNDASISPGGGYENNLFYNPLTGEIVYAKSSVPGLVDGTCWGDYLYWNPATPGWDVGSTKIHLGCNAGASSQGTEAVAIGATAGYTNQGDYAVAIGREAGRSGQSQASVAIGPWAGWSSQGYESVAVGVGSGRYGQGEDAVAIGSYAGETLQGKGSIAIGDRTGILNQGDFAVAIGREAGHTNQGQYSVAIGASSAITGQGVNAIAIGKLSGVVNTGATNATAPVANASSQLTQQNSSIILNATGLGLNTDGGTAVGRPMEDITGVGISSAAFYVKPIRHQRNDASISPGGGYENNLFYNPLTGEIVYAKSSVPGLVDGTCWGDYLYWNPATLTPGWDVGSTQIHLGCNAGASSQGDAAVAIGNEAGHTNQGTESVAIGYQSGYSGQENTAVAIGAAAGHTSQGQSSVAIGTYAGSNVQGSNSIAAGPFSGYSGQGSNSVVIGSYAGYLNQGQYSVAIGASSALTGQGVNAIAIGSLSGVQNTTTTNATAPVANASSQLTQQNSSIILNATGVGLNTDGGTAVGRPMEVLQGVGTSSAAFYVKPIRHQLDNASVEPSAAYGNSLFYNPSTGEIVYSAVDPSGGDIASGTCWGDYLYWNPTPTSGSSRWAVGSTDIHLGCNAGRTDQGSNAIAIGNASGRTNQGNNAIAIGSSSAITGQGNNAIAIGNYSGVYNPNYATGEPYSELSQSAKTIVLNADDTGLNTDGCTVPSRANNRDSVLFVDTNISGQGFTPGTYEIQLQPSAQFDSRGFPLGSGYTQAGNIESDSQFTTNANAYWYQAGNNGSIQGDYPLQPTGGIPEYVIQNQQDYVPIMNAISASTFNTTNYDAGPVPLRPEITGSGAQAKLRPMEYTGLFGVGYTKEKRTVVFKVDANANVSDVTYQKISDTGFYELPGTGTGMTIQLVVDGTQDDVQKLSININRAVPGGAAQTASVGALVEDSHGNKGYLLDPIPATVTTISARVRLTSPMTPFALGEVNNINVTNGGTGYTAAPNVTIAAPTTPGGIQATAAAVISGGFIDSITVVDGGSGYTSAPNVTIAAPPAGGTQATAMAEVMQGAISIGDPGEAETNTAVVVNTLMISFTVSAVDSQNFKTGQTMEVSGTGLVAGTDDWSSIVGARLIINVTPTSVGIANTNVTGTLPQGAQIFLSGVSPLGYIAEADYTFVTNVDSLLQTSILSLGSGYRQGDRVTISQTQFNAQYYKGITGSGVNSITVTNVGSGYYRVPLVTIDQPPSGGSQARGIAVLSVLQSPPSGRTVTGVIVTDSGSGYTSPPNVTIAAPTMGNQATAEATISTTPGSFRESGSLITLTLGTYCYQQPPPVPLVNEPDYFTTLPPDFTKLTDTTGITRFQNPKLYIKISIPTGEMYGHPDQMSVQQNVITSVYFDQSTLNYVKSNLRPYGATTPTNHPYQIYQIAQGDTIEISQYQMRRILKNENLVFTTASGELNPNGKVILKVGRENEGCYVNSIRGISRIQGGENLETNDGEYIAPVHYNNTTKELVYLEDQQQYSDPTWCAFIGITTTLGIFTSNDEDWKYVNYSGNAGHPDPGNVYALCAPTLDPAAANQIVSFQATVCSGGTGYIGLRFVSLPLDGNLNSAVVLGNLNGILMVHEVSSGSGAMGTVSWEMYCTGFPTNGTQRRVYAQIRTTVTAGSDAGQIGLCWGFGVGSNQRSLVVIKGQPVPATTRLS